MGNEHLNKKLLCNLNGNYNDEYYTSREGAEELLQDYWEKIKGKKVYCPCDSDWSEIYKLLKEKENEYNLKVYHSSDDYKNHLEEMKKKSDIIITNPPFSKIREFIADLENINVDYVIIGPVTFEGYKICSDLFFKGRIDIKHLKNSNYSGKNEPSIIISSIGCKKKIFVPTMKFKKENYKTYDGMPNIINVDIYKNIPCDYYGEMGIPITSLEKIAAKDYSFIKILRPCIDKKAKFSRIIVKRLKS